MLLVHRHHDEYQCQCTIHEDDIWGGHNQKFKLKFNSGLLNTSPNKKSKTMGIYGNLVYNIITKHKKYVHNYVLT